MTCKTSSKSGEGMSNNNISLKIVLECLTIFAACFVRSVRTFKDSVAPVTFPDKMMSGEAFEHRWSSHFLTGSPQKSFRKKNGKKHLLKEGSCQNIKDGINAIYIVEIIDP